ncbi:MAG: hypothetical protein J6R77_07050 [Clostridia bacterium]|nr:hypothetical protein [Clostridia bacterium]
MKRVLRLCAFVLVAVLLCGALCGCDMLDDARANHAQWTANGHILLGGVEYLPIPYSAYLCPIYSTERMVFVTDEEVPVLLSPLWGTNMDISQDGSILYQWATETYYCRADKYEYMLQRLGEGFTPVGYGYTYYEYGSFNLEDFKERYYALTPEQTTALNKVYHNVTPHPYSYEEDIYFDYYVYLEEHSEDLLFRQDSNIELNVAGDTYYLIEYTGEHMDEMLLYEVPKEYKKQFAAIMKPLIESEEALYDALGFDEEFYEDYEEEDFGALGDLLGM